MRFILAFILTCLTLPALAQPDVGDPAPDFSMTGSDGKTYRLDALAGRGFVIAFFPKAFTGG